MIFKPHGKHLVAGEWIATGQTFKSEPASGPAFDFSVGTTELANKAAEAAEEAFWSFGYSTRDERSAFLDAIADEIEARGAAITEIGSAETGLPGARLEGERARTTGQLRLFASHIRKGEYLDRRHDEALPDRKPLPRPDIRLIQRPIGPVAVFGASNFPLAFSTMGGDTASALAAGCPVVVKGHSAHPGTGEIVAEAALAAIKAHGLHPGVFSLIQGGRRDVGTGLVTHPLIKAVGFTGSLAGGRALFDLCAGRPEPIPFFGELGSVNPMFLLPEAIKARGAEIAKGWAGSLTMGAGQFCTNPGIAVILAEQAPAFAKAARAALSGVEPQVMLTEGIARAYREGRDRVSKGGGVREILSTSCGQRDVTPNLFLVPAREWLGNHVLAEEVFGPLGLIVTVESFEEMIVVAKRFKGQLTATLHLDDGDVDFARKLMVILERKAGRILTNGYPTGVEVCDAMVHGGPYPASTNFGASSVGTMAIRRFLRPISYQNIPERLMPQDLKSV
ncbi:aldehyde dehydrogenase (NADP(+)) [Sinorhizobium sp. Sb3]|uniref:aldehyde dehydrogenase (NADP(+)) n=1 Tax=Sinorhizobium/Ensifer group TaxID=227292 RepID=UPI00071D482F|nr:aldehyde dehydrogenase (NADP(+)) [Sinorhizobium sp. Sb3]KSV62757.1 2,5-dioxovalerate dehydrogenase [Sinorhizobium sp. Sb3]